MSGMRRAQPGTASARRVFVYVVLTAAAIVMLIPFYWQISTSLSTNAEVMGVPPSFWPAVPQFENYARVGDKIPLASQLLVSSAVTALRVAGQLVTCVLAGYAFARMEFRGRKVVFGLVLSLLMVPPQIFLIPQYLIIKDLGLLNTTLGIALPGFFSSFGIFLMRQAFAALPSELEDAARLDGANPFQTFLRVMLPLVGPTISALVIITVIWSWNDLLWPLIVSARPEAMPISVGLATFQGRYTTDYSVMMAASVIATIPTLALFLVLQRRVLQGLAFSGLK